MEAVHTLPCPLTPDPLGIDHVTPTSFTFPEEKGQKLQGYIGDKINHTLYDAVSGEFLEGCEIGGIHTRWYNKKQGGE